MKKNVVIRADGGTSIGMGHVVRCTALAEMLINDFNIVFAIQNPNDSVKKVINKITDSIIELENTSNYEKDASNFCKHISINDIVVLDGYNFKTEYQQAIKDIGCKLVVIDDLHDCHHIADIVINHADNANESDYSAEFYTKFCLGLDYILLRKEFLNIPFRNQKIKNVSRFFVSMGAADIHNNTAKFAEALIDLKTAEEIHLMVSDLNPHLSLIENLAFEFPEIKLHFNLPAKKVVELIQYCDVVICPASSISLESCAVGVGLISGYTAENQIGNLNGLIKHKTLINFGNINQLSIKEVKSKLLKLIPYPTVFNELITNQKQMIDGKSPNRMLAVFKNLN